MQVRPGEEAAMKETLGERRVGVDRQRDRGRGLTVSSGGITVVGKGQVVAPNRR